MTSLCTKIGFRDCRFYPKHLPPKAHMLAASSTSRFENIENLSNFDFDPLPLPLQYLGKDLLSLIVVAIVGVVWVVEEVGGLFGWVVGISLVVGVEVVEIVSLLVSILDGWNCNGWDVLVVFVGILGLLEVVFCWL